MKYQATKKKAEKEYSANETEVDGRHKHMRGPNHEFGEHHDGKHFHDHHRDKDD